MQLLFKWPNPNSNHDTYFASKIAHMQEKNRSSSPVETFQLIILFSAYIIICLALLSWFIFPGFIYPVFKESTGLVVAFISIIIFIIIGAFLYVLFKIPFQLQYDFDDIKNRIANKELSTIDEFEKELSDFIIRFFNFAFFDIQECVIQIKNRKYFFSSELLKDLLNYDNLSKKSAETPKTIKLGKIRSKNQKYHVLLLPIWFGKEWYGFILIFSRTRLLPIYRKMLEDFENNYIDDQLIHVYKNSMENTNKN